MHTTFLNSVEQFIGCMKPNHTVEHTAEEICTGHQIAASPNHTQTSPSTKELPQPEPQEDEEEEGEEEIPSDTSAATTTVLHICGYLLLSLSILHM
jgi:hypothetical protein